MLSIVYMGELAENEWNSNKDPFKVLKQNIDISKYVNSDKLFTSDNKYLSDKIQVDWGSFAWKCNGKNFLNFLKEYSIPIIKNIDINKEYGVVWIDEGIEGEDIFDYQNEE